MNGDRRVDANTTTIAEAEAFWARYARFCRQQSEEILHVYTDDSLIFEDVPGYKTMVKRGAMYVPVVRALLRAANRRGEKILDSSFRDVQFVEIGENVAINATRHSIVKDYDSPFSLLVGKDANKRVVVIEERMEHLNDEPVENVEITIEIDDDATADDN